MGAIEGLRKGLGFLIARVKALRDAVRVDNVRLAHRSRMNLVSQLRRVDIPERDDVLQLFRVSGLWVRNIGDRREIKRIIQQISRRILERLSRRSAERYEERFLNLGKHPATAH
jgi:hypothetical protein